LRRFDLDTLRSLAGEKAYARGEAYFREGHVQILAIGPKRVLAQVPGTDGPGWSGFAACRHDRAGSHARIDRGQVLPRALKIVLAFFAGLAVGEALPIAWYILATKYFGLFDRDGDGAMGAIFIAGPVLAVLVGTMAAIVTAKRTA
jgi:hypothetical protein